MWYIYLRSTGEQLAGPFATLHEANTWHDSWLDEVWPYVSPDDDNAPPYPSCEFRKE